jgi:5-methylcytosine-specific restriction endonuclease McrA
MECKTGHSFSYSKLEFKNATIHIVRKCFTCGFRDYVSRKDLPSNVNFDELPLKATKNRRKVIKKQNTNKEKDIKTITRKKVSKTEVVRITKTVKKQIKIDSVNNTNLFYNSDKWLALRYKALLKYGRKCMCCFTENVEMHVDHIKPRSLYPKLELDINNLQILCKHCNLGKSNKDDTDFRIKS